MKGYFTFVLVFISVILVLNSFENYALNASQSHAKQISIERAYQIQLNVKEAMLEAARSGAQAGLEEYVLTHPEDEFDIAEAREAARKKALELVSRLDGWEFDPDFETALWCGYTGEMEIERLKRRMLDEGRLAICNECSRISYQECGNFVNVDIGTGGKIASVWLGANNPMNPLDEGLVGVSIYSGKFGVSGAGFLPQSEKREIG